MFKALETLPAEEMARRHAVCRAIMAKIQPEAGGLLVFSRVAIYYLTGTFGNGVFWLPTAGTPALMIRKGMERARLESPLSAIVPFRSYGDIPKLCAEAGSPLTPVVAADKSGLSWGLAELLMTKLADTRFVSADMILSRAQAVKSEWELAKMRLCGARHHKALHEILPERLKPGMTEREISLAVWDVFFSLGHQGIMRMGAQGEELFLGHVSAGDSGNYPSAFNGPVGLRGEHPAMAVMGYAGKTWRKGEPLCVDCGFVLEGYMTDKTQVFWAGPKSSIPDEVARAHAFCMDVQAYAAENLKPGGIPGEIYAHCKQWAAKVGFADGFMGLGSDKVSFIGHGIGLTMDAWPVLAKGFDEPLEAGTTMALEPKIGIPDVGMVGVENTFEVAASGGVCVTGGQYGMIAVE